MASTKPDNERKPALKTIEAGGVAFRTAVWSGDDDERPLLVFNGIGANLELLSPLSGMLGERTIIAFDAPGVGGSGPARIPYRPWVLARNAANILDQLGYDQVDVMGISWGGGIAQQFAFQYKKRARRLILVATSAGSTMVPGSPSALTKLFHPRRYTDPAYMLKNFKELYGDENQIAGGHASRLLAPSIRGYLMQLLAMAGWSSLPFLPFLKLPTLVLSGTRDKIVPVVNGKILSSLIPGAEFQTVDGGHLFLLSKSDETMPHIRRFLGV